MQPDVDAAHYERFISQFCNYFHGKGGDTPTKGDIKEAQNIRRAHEDSIARLAAGKQTKAKSIIIALQAVYAQSRALNLTGDPDRDWRAIRNLLEQGVCPRLKDLALEARSIRLLSRGTQLRQELSQDWRDNRAYVNALSITQRAFVREHFSTNSKPETGVVVNMHKAKGKQFDEVIIFEGWPRIVRRQIVGNPHRIVRNNDRAHINDQSRQNFRVSVTRGKQRTTILTPNNDPCVLLPGA
jgi:DNA helicase-2/ATP-dependent DNA helicase PcrA